MDILFIHNNFPAQYRNLAPMMAESRQNRVVFATKRPDGEIKGVQKVIYAPHRSVRQDAHPYLRGAEAAVLDGQAAYTALRALKHKGFAPAVICAHSGWGPSLYLKDLWPDAKLLSYFEWYYSAERFEREECHFLGVTLSEDDRLRQRTRNVPILLDWAACDWGVCPTEFQLGHFPSVMRSKISVLHDGVDVDFFSPRDGVSMTIGSKVLRKGDEIVTYVARGMEPYRGFPTFMRAMAILQRRRPNLQVVVVGEDRVAYGRKRSDGKGYKEEMLAETRPDLSRTHFPGLVPLRILRDLLRVSAAHVYYTVPFVLSWSMLEAMATGVLLIGSDTEPVREVVRDGENGLLADFFSPEDLAAKTEMALENQERLASLRDAARHTIMERYALPDMLKRQRALIDTLASGRLPVAPDHSE